MEIVRSVLRHTTWFGLLIVCNPSQADFGSRSVGALCPSYDESLTYLEEAAIRTGDYSRTLRDLHSYLPDGTFRVFVRSERGFVGDTARQAVKSGLRAWESATHDAVVFEIVPSVADADIIVWVSDRPALNGQPTAGMVRIAHVPVGNVRRLRAHVDIRSRTTGGAPMNFAAMRHALMHEVGHVLGLDDSNVGGVMSRVSLAHPEDAPHPDEARTVMRQRRRIRTIMRNAILKS
ncbi:MAG: matrixin family metalloprotease [Fimbriimonadaceae bacterium]|nr:matrixin family metalloprotease [Fimbriimonadaceae bacterium]